MAEPYRRPAVGSHPGLYRLLRDNMYFTAGTIVALDPDQVNPSLHELVGHPADADQVAELHGKVNPLTDAVHEHSGMLETMRADWEAMKARVAEMEETIRGMQTPATPPPPPETPAAPPAAPPAAETVPDVTPGPHTPTE